MAEIKLNEAALAAAYKAYGIGQYQGGTPLADGIRAYLSADPDRAARDAVVEAAVRLVELGKKPIPNNRQEYNEHQALADGIVGTLRAAVAALPKETSHD